MTMASDEQTVATGSKDPKPKENENCRGENYTRPRNLKKRTDRLKSVHDMDVLTSPSRGVNLGKNLMQYDIQDQYWTYIDEQVTDYGSKYASIKKWWEEPQITPLQGTPQHLLPSNEPTCNLQAKESLGRILHAVRKLREGLVASQRKDGLVVQGASAQYLRLCLSVSKLMEYVYLDPESEKYKNWDGLTSVGMIKKMVSDVTHQTHSFLQDTLSSCSVFSCLWLLESLTSGRPGHVQEYLQRRNLLLQREDSQSRLINENHLQFAQKAYLAIVRGSFKDLLCIMKDTSEQNYWPKLLALRLCTRLRNHAYTIMRKAYLQIPIRQSMVDLVRGETSVTILARNQSSIDWFDSMMFLNGTVSKDVQILWWIGEGSHHKHWSETIAFVAPRIRGAADAHVLAWRP